MSHKGFMRVRLVEDFSKPNGGTTLFLQTVVAIPFLIYIWMHDNFSHTLLITPEVKQDFGSCPTTPSPLNMITIGLSPETIPLHK